MPAKHLSTERAYHRMRRAQLIAAGLCICCGKVPPHGTLRRCLPCQEIARASSRAYIARQRASWRALGICVVCGVRVAMPQRRWCGACAEAHAERKARRRAA